MLASANYFECKVFLMPTGRKEDQENYLVWAGKTIICHLHCFLMYQQSFASFGISYDRSVEELAIKHFFKVILLMGV